MEHHGLVLLGPGEVQRQSPVLRADPVLESALVEEVAGELGEGRVHSVLDLQPEGPDPENNKSLEQRLTQPSGSRLLTHHHRSQL